MAAITIQELLMRLGMDVDGTSFDKANLAIAGIRNGMMGFGDILVRATRALINTTRELAGVGVAVTRTAQSLGLSTDSLQELQYVAKSAGVESAGLATAVGFLSKKMYESSHGSKKAAQAFSDVGVSVTDANGSLKPVNMVFGELADKFNAMPDGAEKTALSMILLSRTGKQMVPVFNKGSAEIARLSQEAHDMGLVLDADALAKSEELTTTWRDMTNTVEGLRRQALVPLMASVTHIALFFTRWVNANKKLIAQNLAKVFVVLGAAIRVVGRVLTGIVQTFFAILNFKPAFYGLVAILGVLTAAWLAAGAAAMWSGMVAFVMWVEAAAPVAILLVLLGIIVLVAQSIWVALRGGKSVVGELWEKWNAFIDAWLLNTDGDGWFITALKEIIWTLTHLGEVLASVFDGIKTAIDWVMSRMTTVADFLGINPSQSDLDAASHQMDQKELSKMSDKEIAQELYRMQGMEQFPGMGGGSDINAGYSNQLLGEQQRRTMGGASSVPGANSIMHAGMGILNSFGQPRSAQITPSGGVSVVFSPSITVHAPNANNPQQIAAAVNQHVGTFFNRALRQAKLGAK